MERNQPNDTVILAFHRHKHTGNFRKSQLELLYLRGQMQERAYILRPVVCCLLDVCGLWLCFSPISVFGVVSMPIGPPVNSSHWLATPEGTAATETPERV